MRRYTAVKIITCQDAYSNHLPSLYIHLMDQLKGHMHLCQRVYYKVSEAATVHNLLIIRLRNWEHAHRSWYKALNLILTQENKKPNMRVCISHRPLMPLIKQICTKRINHKKKLIKCTMLALKLPALFTDPNNQIFKQSFCSPNLLTAIKVNLKRVYHAGL